MGTDGAPTAYEHSTLPGVALTSDACKRETPPEFRVLCSNEFLFVHLRE
jgi:hypothetical protein